MKAAEWSQYNTILGSYLVDQSVINHSTANLLKQLV